MISFPILWLTQADQDAWSRPTAAEERLQEDGNQRPREDLMSRLQREFGLSVEEEEERETTNGKIVLREIFH